MNEEPINWRSLFIFNKPGASVGWKYQHTGKEEADQTKQNHYFVAGTGEGTAAAWKVGGRACQLISLIVANATK